jgi:hypothetical protein
MAVQRLREAPLASAAAVSGGAGLAAIAAGGLSVGGIGSDGVGGSSGDGSSGSSSSASSFAIAADFQYEAHRRELQLGQPTVFVRNYNELVETKKTLLLKAAGSGDDGHDGPGGASAAATTGTAAVGSGLTVDEINAKLTLHSPRSFLEALLQQLHQDVEAVKSKGPSEAWRRAAQTKGVLRALQGLVLQQPALAERILQLNRFPLILSVLAPNFSDAVELQLEAVRGLCASAASVPRCGDSIGGAAVSYVPYLFSKLEGLSKGGGGGVDAVAVELGAASLQLLGCVCRVPACSDSLAKAADPHSLATLVRALARRQPAALQLLLCTLLPPLSRHTAATATFSQRALGAHLIAALLDLLCGKAAADTKQHAARLLAALGGNPSGGNAIRAELEKVEVWSHYGKIPPSNTGNDIARLQREMGMLGRFDPSKADQIGGGPGGHAAAAAAVGGAGASATERARLRLLLKIRSIILGSKPGDNTSGGGVHLALALRTRRARLGPTPLPYAPLLQPGLLAKEAEHEAKMEEQERATGHLRKARQERQAAEDALGRTRAEQERSAQLVREQEERQRQQKEKEDYERYHREQQQSYLRQAQQEQALLRSAVAPAVQAPAIVPPTVAAPVVTPAGSLAPPAPPAATAGMDDDDDAEQQSRELERMRERQAEKRAEMDAERIEVERKLKLAMAAAEQDRKKAEEEDRRRREEEERRREWDQQQMLERQAQAESKARADALAKDQQEADARAEKEAGEAAAAVAAAAAAVAPAPAAGGFDLLARMEANEQSPDPSPTAEGAGAGTFDLLAAVASRNDDGSATPPSTSPAHAAPDSGGFDLVAKLDAKNEASVSADAGSQGSEAAATTAPSAPAAAAPTFDLLATIDARNNEGSAAVDDFLGEEQFIGDGSSDEEDTANMVL